MPVVGIDLGTTSSRVAAVRDGAPVIIENAEGEGTTPSCVALTASGELLVGEAARRQATTNHENTIYSVKRLIGRRYDDPIIDPLKALLPYKIVRADNGDAWIELGGRARSPQEISSLILRKMKETAESFLGCQVSQAVITVPAYFNDAQRQATKDAGRLAGLEVLRTVAEPTAAALAYAFDKPKTFNKSIAVFDLGGGTFDISLLSIGDGVYEVLSTAGDTFLGGEDFDLAIVGYLVDTFEQNHKIDLRTNKLALQRLKEAAELAKITLSSANNAYIKLPFLAVDEFGPKHLDAHLPREVFESLVRPLVTRAIKISAQSLKRALTDGRGRRYDMKVSEIEEVILVGGSTRMPMVVDAVIEFFGRDPYKGMRREDAVALGAAIQAGVLKGQVKDVLLLDVTPFSLGIEAAGGKFVSLIERGTTIPTKKTQVFSTAADNQTAVAINVFQGESEHANENRLIGRLELQGITRGPQGATTVEVVFDIDANGIVHVSVKEQQTGKEQSIRIQVSGGLTEKDMRRIIDERVANASNLPAGAFPADNRDPVIAPIQSEAPVRRSAVSRVVKKEARRLFLSYAREDEQWARRVEKALAVLTRSGRLDLWIDRSLKSGAKWEAEIYDAIDRSNGAILLLSDNFLSSEFIQSKELPRIFAAREKGKYHFMPIVVSFCPFSLQKDLAQFQTFNNPERPFSSIPDWEVDKELTRLATEIAARLS